MRSDRGSELVERYNLFFSKLINAAFNTVVASPYKSASEINVSSKPCVSAQLLAVMKIPSRKTFMTILRSNIRGMFNLFQGSVKRLYPTEVVASYISHSLNV